MFLTLKSFDFSFYCIIYYKIINIGTVVRILITILLISIIIIYVTIFLQYLTNVFLWNAFIFLLDFHWYLIEFNVRGKEEVEHGDGVARDIYSSFLDWCF